jgi:hypothetical protein
MDFVSVALLVFVAVVCGGVLAVGVAALVSVRSGRREKLQMKRHVQRLAVASSDSAIPAHRRGRDRPHSKAS